MSLRVFHTIFHKVYVLPDSLFHAPGKGENLHEKAGGGLPAARTENGYKIVISGNRIVTGNSSQAMIWYR